MKLIFILLLALAGFAFADQSSALKVLATADATMEQKANACDELGRVGTADSVPVLADLLADKHLHDYARDALERIPDPAAGKALVNALSELKGAQLTGVIITLGDRAAAPAVPALSKLARKKGTGPQVRAAALTSLAQIGDDQSMNTVLSVLENGDAQAKSAAAQATLAAAARLERAALRLKQKVAAADIAEHLKAAAGK